MNECSSKKVYKVITIGDSPIVIPRDVTQLIFEGEEVPKWFSNERCHIVYENLITITGYNLKKLDLGLFPHTGLPLTCIHAPLAILENSCIHIPLYKKLQSLICKEMNYYSKLPESIEELNCLNKASWRLLYKNISSYANLRVLRLDGVTELPIDFRFPLGIEYLSLESLPKIDVSYLKNLKWCKFR